MSHYYNEHNAYRAAVLRERMAEGLLPEGIVDERDIESIPDKDFAGYTQIHLFAGIGGFPLGLRRAGFPEDVRIVTGGFPCQDISNAGKRAGITGTRSGLWREMVRCIRVVRPQLVFVENVAALLCRGMGEVLGDLAAIGYDAQGDCISAADVGAPHLRRRIWIVAYPIGSRIRLESIAISYADAQRCDRRLLEEPRSWARGRSTTERDHTWPVEPNVGRVAHGIPRRVDRLAALGDAIVPACVEAVVRRFFR